MTLPGETGRTARADAAGLALGYLVDHLVGDPRRFHPVAGFGRVAGRVERLVYADRRGPGIVMVGLLAGVAAALGAGLDRLTTRRPLARTGAVAVATWAVLGGRSLRREALTLGRQLEAGDLAAARVQVTHLVGRDPSGLDAAELARAGVESVAENTSDAVVAPLIWGALAGLPGLLAYRGVNTLDAMIGHRSPRYQRFGWAAARLDDAANWLPARLALLLTAAAAPAIGGSGRDVLQTARRDAGRHPSPNAGVVEAGFAGALRVRLGGQSSYGGQVEDRGTLGDGPPPTVHDLPRAVRLSAMVSGLGLLAAVVIRGWRR